MSFFAPPAGFITPAQALARRAALEAHKRAARGFPNEPAPVPGLDVAAPLEAVTMDDYDFVRAMRRSLKGATAEQIKARLAMLDKQDAEEGVTMASAMGRPLLRAALTKLEVQS
jgi:hypothetical protein